MFCHVKFSYVIFAKITCNEYKKVVEMSMEKEKGNVYGIVNFKLSLGKSFL